MIKDIKTVIGELLSSTDNKENILKEYANSIIDECAGNFECTMEQDLDDPSCNSQEHPVLMRGSILVVKNQIK